MRVTVSIPIPSVNHFCNQLCRWLEHEPYGVLLRSNNYFFDNPLHDNLNHYQLIAAIGAEEIISSSSQNFSALEKAVEKNDWLFGYLSYDLKNEVESLSSQNIDGLNFHNMLFIRPLLVFELESNTLHIHYRKGRYNSRQVGSLFDSIMAKKTVVGINDNICFTPRFSKDEYIATTELVLHNIQRGDIYEMNICQEFFANPCEINPYETYLNLNNASPTPFSAFGKFDDKYLLCASPERYLKKQGNTIVSQPIKGTCERGLTEKEDLLLRDNLKADAKERAENIMIVDLIRNDLSRIAKKGTVNVEELCGVYPFKQVNQMISTVSCKIEESTSVVDILKATFPMGSMTGAPKVRAMELIEKYERTKRGLFSGAVGYISPDGNFDFNVVIRSLLYNKSQKYLSYTVGGAITSGSIPENEYNECMLKAKAIIQSLKL